VHIALLQQVTADFLELNFVQHMFSLLKINGRAALRVHLTILYFDVLQRSHDRLAIEWTVVYLA